MYEFLKKRHKSIKNDWQKKKIWVNQLFIRNRYIKFQDPGILSWSIIIQTHQTVWWTDTLMNELTKRPKAICPSNFFTVCNKKKKKWLSLHIGNKLLLPNLNNPINLQGKFLSCLIYLPLHLYMLSGFICI